MVSAELWVHRSDDGRMVTLLIMVDGCRQLEALEGRHKTVEGRQMNRETLRSPCETLVEHSDV